MNPFENAWQILKELDTQDLQQAARTGGIGMTPERRQAYTDAGLPLNTGGGFRTMPETEAQRIMRYQRTGSLEGMDKEIGFNPRRTTIGYDPEGEALAETQGASIDPMSDDEPPPEHPSQNFLEPIPKSISDLRRLPNTRGRFAGRANLIEDDRGRRRPNPGRIRIGELEQEQKNIAARNRDIASALGKKQRQVDRRLDARRADIEGRQGPVEFPTGEFARRGNASASPSDQAFKVIQQRREAAEAHEQVLAERQREMQMNALRNKMRNQPNIQRKQRGRRGQGPNSRKNRMKQRRN
jgi:hypothetical protein